MSGHTANWRQIKPTVSGDADVWGGYLNDNFDSEDLIYGGVITTTGSANAYVITSGQSATAYSTQRFCFKANFTNTGAATLNLDGLGAKNIYKQTAAGPSALSAGDIVSGQIYLVAYDGTQFQIFGASASLWQPYDATLSALAALSWASGNALLQFTAADTVSLTLAPSVTTITASNAANAVVPTGRFTNTNDNASVIAATFEGDRATMAANDSVYVSFNLSDSAGNQDEMAYILVQATTVTSGSEASSIIFYNRVAGTLASRMILAGTNLRPSSNDLISLGSATSSWADLFLASGGVINCNNGNAILAHVTGGFDQTVGALAAPTLLSSETGGTLTSASRNRRVVCSSAPTLPASGMTVGDWILIDPNGTARTITRPAAHAMYVRDTDSATATSYARNPALAVFQASGVWLLNGVT